MSDHRKEIQRLAEEFESCQKILLALDDENRQHLILEMMKTEECGGVRVGVITEKTHLSRPAVSHHLQILKDVGILKMRREGTTNYHYFDADTEAMNRLIHMLGPKDFDGFMAHYGKFSGVKNYIALIGKKDALLDEKCGYYGERLVLKAQQLGLNTCWVALTYSKVKTAFVIDKGEKLCAVIAVGYGETQGVSHKSRIVSEVAKAGKGFYTKLDLSIVKYHFEIGVGDARFQWG